MQTNNPIKIKELTYRYCKEDPHSQVLNSIELEVSKGELIILTGASGSGKTTLLTLIGGLRTGAEGYLEILGKNIVSANRRELVEIRKQIGFIFQSHNLLPYLTAQENIRVGLEVHESWRRKDVNRIEEKCFELLEILELSHRANFKPKDLSIGQKQRISIARAIANTPEIILADEPTASLDKDSARIVISLLKEYAETNKCSVIIITHDNKILDYADRIIKLENGLII